MVRGHDWSGGDADGSGEGLVTKVGGYELLILRDAVNKKTGYFMTLCKKVGG